MKLLTLDDLYKYQTHCVDLVIDNPKFGLFLDMGLGKTVICLTAVNFLMYEDLEIDSCLVVGTKRVIESVWVQEAKTWGHTKHLSFSSIHGTEKQRIKGFKAKADIHLVSRDNIAWLIQLSGGRLPYDMIVLDESSSFKNHQSIRFKALKKATTKTARITLLTGTPSPNTLLDLWAQIFLLDRGERLGKYITHFRDAYFSRGYDGWSYKCSEIAEREIHNKLKDICISMKTEDYRDLPPMQFININVTLPPAIQRKYKEFERERVLEFIERDEPVTAMSAAALFGKLLQFANGTIYTSPIDPKDREVINVHTAKLDALAELVDEHNGKPVLVAYGFQHGRDRILKRFKKLRPRILDNDKTVEAWNAKKIRMLVTHPASGGHGLNLQHGGNVLIWFGLNPSLELYQQLNKRLHRGGITKPVYIFHLVVKGTADERVMSILQRKDKTQNRLLEAVKALIKSYKK